ncbi:Uncharacterised protein [Mycobacteroides abscessus subsp. abscessus]|nr:Uncharacterised protein [Mycobacteroides abscessus subsp. abscessus]SLC89041.1 Uncharacterised protein [Mycobacteroides abscessus subsp. massiliense]
MNPETAGCTDSCRTNRQISTSVAATSAEMMAGMSEETLTATTKTITGIDE